MLTCPHCQTENRPQANFCKRCGWVIAVSCPRCRGDLLNEADFCDHCGLPLTPRAAFQWGSATPFALDLKPGQIKAQTSKGMLQPTAAPRIQSTAPEQALTAPTPIDNLERFVSNELLAKLDAARASGGMVGERRVVTMLFCDVKGSTAAAEKLDPEDWSEIMNGAFEYMISPVYAYEGIVARMQGDSILAFFGAPITHEDDPQRAVLAGLDIIAGIKNYREDVQQRFGIEFNVRVGINTGMVVVGVVGSDLRMEYTALGDAINLAARMEQTAEPGSVQIAQDTYKLIKNMFEIAALGKVEMKGKSEPVPVYRVLGRTAHRDALVVRQRGIEGLSAEMVGRESEMQSLLAVFNDLNQGVGWIVCVLGEAGLGKSRLVKEAHTVIVERFKNAPDWYETGSLSYETNQAYGLFLRLIQQTCTIGYDEPGAQVRVKISELVEDLEETHRLTALRVFETLFGLSSANGNNLLQSESFKEELLETMQVWWRTRFSTRPAVLVFDDMHWSDPASVELIAQLLPLTEELPLALIFSMRPERETPAWRLKAILETDYRHLSTELSLRPLSDLETNELVDRLLAIAELPDSLRGGILERAGGNPFFVEEVVRSLIENGIVIPEERIVAGVAGDVARRYWVASRQEVDFEIPDNLQTLLSTRIDRLEEDTRGTLQIAAVIGRSFYRRVLQAVDEAERDLDKRLGTLMRVDMIREAARMPEMEYSFRNPLTQEAVYNTILYKRRREFHRKVGEAMELLFTERAEAMSGLLAHHFSLSGQPDKAAGYYRLLAKQAMAVFAYDEAQKNLRQALELIGDRQPDERHLALLEELGDASRHLRDGTSAIQAYQRALAAYAQLDQAQSGSSAVLNDHQKPLTRLRLNRKIVQVISNLKWTVSKEDLSGTHDIRAVARTNLEADLDVLVDGTPYPELARALTTLAIDAWRIQEPPDWDAAEGYAQKAVEMAGRLEDPLELSRAIGALATVLDGRSRLREHLQTAQERLAIIQESEIEDRRERTEALRGVGAALMYVGEYDQALRFLQEAGQLAEQTHSIEEKVNSLGLQAQCYLRLDRWDEVLEVEEQWRDLERRYTRERVGET